MTLYHCTTTRLCLCARLPLWSLKKPASTVIHKSAISCPSVNLKIADTGIRSWNKCLTASRINDFKKSCTVFRRYYRVKTGPSDLSIEQEFLQRTLQRYGRKISKEDVRKIYIQKFRLLVSSGCKPCGLVEYPRILDYSIDQLINIIEQYNSLNLQKISIPLLKFVTSNNWERTAFKNIEKYIKTNNGRINQIDGLTEALECNEEMMMKIFTRNPRLYSRDIDQFIEKIKILRQYGAHLDDIRSNTHILNNKTLEIIESRAQRLAKLQPNCPLDVGAIGRTDREFERILSRAANFEMSAPMPDSDSVIDAIPELASKKRRIVKSKVDFLLSVGYTQLDIRNNLNLFMYCLPRIRSSWEYLQGYHIGKVNLQQCFRYLKVGMPSGNTRRYSLRKKLSDLLKCSVEQLPSCINDSKLNKSTQTVTPDVLSSNYNLLLDSGYTCSSILKVPIVLAHESDVLNNALATAKLEYADFFARYKEDKVKQLNIIQYVIEKSCNFNYLSVTSSTLSSGLSDEADESHDVNSTSMTNDLNTEKFTKLDLILSTNSNSSELSRTSKLSDSVLKMDTGYSS